MHGRATIRTSGPGRTSGYVATTRRCSYEAERLLRETLPIKTHRRKIYKLLAEEALKEIENASAASPDARFQLDWRWVRRYRTLSAYDAYWWWAPAGPLTDEEQRQWEKLFTAELDEVTKDQLREILVQSRDRELSTARAAHREPRLSYPALAIAEVRQRIADFLQLDAEIADDEPNVVVRRLYHGAIEDEVCFLRLIEATYEGEGERFWELTQHLYPQPTSAEMQYALEHRISLWRSRSCANLLLPSGLNGLFLTGLFPS